MLEPRPLVLIPCWTPPCTSSEPRLRDFESLHTGIQTKLGFRFRVRSELPIVDLCRPPIVDETANSPNERVNTLDLL
ncbi:hypothetical protein CC2G_014021 [Coprinopsis cinerea AmutBmut pab1-1]|nr:hypothetical protein CC2G_014021 [Coprinopsis cinerea AmutBmut pab1-1]